MEKVFSAFSFNALPKLLFVLCKVFTFCFFSLQLKLNSAENV